MFALMTFSLGLHSPNYYIECSHHNLLRVQDHLFLHTLSDPLALASAEDAQNHWISTQMAIVFLLLLLAWY